MIKFWPRRNACIPIIPVIQFLLPVRKLCTIFIFPVILFLNIRQAIGFTVADAYIRSLGFMLSEIIGQAHTERGVIIVILFLKI